MGTSEDENPLDNPVWHALGGALSRFAVSPPAAFLRRFDSEVSPFSAVRDVDASTWDQIAAEIGPEGFCNLFRAEIPPRPEGWEEHFRGVCLQLVAGDLGGVSAVDLDPERLDLGDAEEAVALTALTEPGPFLARTIGLGRYVGVRQNGRLMAMAGERFRVPGFVEISAVCTHPDVRGRGFGAALTLDVAHAIRRRGEEAFLHVLEDNAGAIALYERLGFVLRRRIEVVSVQWRGPHWRPEQAV